IDAHVNQQPPRLESLGSRVPAACIEILRACLAKSQSDRVASAQSLAWMARGALRAIEGARSETRRASSTQLPSSRGGVLGQLGLARAPFASTLETRALEHYEPFGTTASALRASLREPGASLLLLGESGSGRSSLLREILTPDFSPGIRAWIDLDAESVESSLELRACHAFGAAPSSLVSKNCAIEGLLEHLADSSRQAGAPALLVVDTSGSLQAYLPELAALSRAASATGYFSLIATSGGELGNALPEPTVVTLPPFSGLQVLEYLRDRLERCRAVGAPPLLVTADAALLLHAHSGGNLTKINRLASHMLTLIAAQRSRVLTSSLAWAASEALDDASAGAGAAARSAGDLLTILNGERASIGLRPREPHLSGAAAREPHA
ncbi:MAG TPA: hypothetical protein VHM25_23125, partial [Polyangiaceae bacterium]|nr:hypothetical protein [Polyangiaceae bacterium]